MLLSQLANKVDADFEGDDVEIKNIQTLEKAEFGDISFLFNKKYIRFLQSTKASAVILPDWAPLIPISSLRSSNPHLVYAKVMNIFKKRKVSDFGISRQATICSGADISENVGIAPYAYIGNGVKIGSGSVIYPNVSILNDVTIGENTIIYSNVSILENVQIGNNVIIHSGTVIGGDGFGFAKDNSGCFIKIPHTGNIIIYDDVEIGSCCAIDRASFGNTIIGKGTKVDNHVHIAHSVEIGENVLLIAQAGLSGSSKIGNNSIMAGKSSLTGHVKVGKNCIIGPLAAVTHDLENESIVGGAPAFNADLWKKSTVAFKKLPDLLKEIRKIKRKLNL